MQLEIRGAIDDAFAGERFEAVIGYGALHHLPLDGLAAKIHARLQDGGRAVFVEPVVNSTLLDWVRQRIPYRPVEVTPDEQPLNNRVLAELARPFAGEQRRHFECLARLHPLFANRDRVVRSLFRIDSWLMKLPPLRRFASVVVLALYR